MQEAFLGEREKIVSCRLVGDTVTFGVCPEGEALLWMPQGIPEERKLPMVEELRLLQKPLDLAHLSRLPS